MHLLLHPRCRYGRTQDAVRFPRPRVCLLRMLAPLLDDLTGLPLTQGRVRVARGDVIEARPKPVEVEPQREVVAHVREPIIQQRGLPSAGGAASRRQARAGGREVARRVGAHPYGGVAREREGDLDVRGEERVEDELHLHP